MKILISTSLRPSPRIRTFCKDLASASSIFYYSTRGKMNILTLFSYARVIGAKRLWLVKSKYGNPGGIFFYDIEKPERIIGSIIIKGVSLKRELKNVFPKSTKNHLIHLIPPEDNQLYELYSVIKNAIPEIPYNNRLITKLKIIKSKYIELNFIESETNLLCGPRIFLSGYSIGDKVMYFEK